MFDVITQYNNIPCSIIVSYIEYTYARSSTKYLNQRYKNKFKRIGVKGQHEDLGFGFASWNGRGRNDLRANIPERLYLNKTLVLAKLNWYKP